MEVTINQQQLTVHSNTVDSVLSAYGLTNTKGIALAINEKVIPKTLWPSTPIQQGDEITIISAAQGG